MRLHYLIQWIKAQSIWHYAFLGYVFQLLHMVIGDKVEMSTAADEGG